MFLLLGAFIAGMLTVLAPCVLPLLPIIIGGSVTGDTKDRKRPVVIAISLALSLFAFTLLLKATTLLIDIPPKSINYASGVIIILLGIFTLFPSIYARIINRLGIEQRAQKSLSKGFNDKRSLVGPAVTGAALGPVFSSCSPVYAYILATVLPANFGQAIAYIIFYILGLTVVLLAIGYYGQGFVRKIKFASDPKGWFQRIIAILFIIVGLMIFTGYDKKFQTYVSTHTPFNFDKLSSQLLPASKNKTNDNRLYNVAEPYQAPEFTGIKQWLNSDPQKMSELKGKVVYVDFWTYSCINCIRNNPYIEKWYQTYKDDGFTVIGVHAPEFSFEKLPANVAKAIKEQKITYPVALDNDFDTWNAYQNQSWPAGYLIDAEGNVRRIHEGEGKYAETEEAIRGLLTENGVNLSGMAKASDSVVPVTSKQTPETYMGSKRASNFVGTPALGAAPQNTFSHPATIGKNNWSLGGTWDVDGEKITARGNSTLRFHIAAKEAYLVASSPNAAGVKVLLDGKPISQTGNAGDDIRDSTFTVNESRLYKLVKYKQFSEGTIELQVPNGVSFNAFTFGS
jgi:cytochrome c biogenesis protein CcdA/thiol-disulfide isomerase/thioredoxin